MGFFKKLWKKAKEIFTPEKKASISSPVIRSPIVRKAYNQTIKKPVKLPPKSGFSKFIDDTARDVQKSIKKTVEPVHLLKALPLLVSNPSPASSLKNVLKLTEPMQDAIGRTHERAMSNKQYRNSVGRGAEAVKTAVASSPAGYLGVGDKHMLDRLNRFEKVDPHLKDDTATKVLRGAGTVAGFMMGGEGNFAKTGAMKLAKTGLGKKGITTLAKSKPIRSLATKELRKAGLEITKDALADVAEKNAKKIVNRTSEGIIRNLTTDMARSNNIALIEGKEFGSKEHLKELRDNALYGTVAELGLGAIPLVKGLKSVDLEKVPMLVNGKTVFKKPPLPKLSSGVEASFDDTLKPFKNKVDDLAKPLKNKTDDLIKPLRGDDLALKTKKIDDVLKPSTLAEEKLVTKELAKPVAQKAPENTDELIKPINDIADEITKPKIPQSNEYGKVAQTAHTLANNYEDKALLKELKNMVDDGTMATHYQSNKVSMDNAKRHIADLGHDKAFDYWKRNVDDVPTMSPNMTAEAKLHLDNAINNGDMQKAVDVMVRLVDSASTAGRNLQAMKMFVNNTPLGRVTMTERVAKKLSEKTSVEIKLDPNDLMHLKEIEDPVEAWKYMDELKIKMWNQVPATWTEKLTAFRYMGMLGNPKTHVRNILGNTLFIPVKKMRDVIKVGLEKTLIRDGEKTASILTRKDKWLSDYAKKFVDLDMNSIGDDTSKYFYGNARPIEAKVFNTKLLEKLNKLNSNALEREDQIFMTRAYKEYFAKYLKANGARSIDSIDKEMLSKAREYATNEALDSTFREFSALANMLNGLKRWHNTPMKELGNTRGERVLKKGAGIIGESIMPFAKTPANILKKGIEYSPVGLMKGIGKVVTAKGDNTKMLNAINDLAEGITGTGLFAIGAYLANKGIATGSIGNDKLDKFRKDLGEQEYSIKIGDWSYSMDWAAPISIPFFAGVEAGKAFTQENGISADSLIDSLTKITEPVFNMSMLQGVENAFKTDQYSGVSTGMQVLTNAMTGYANQFLPTIGGQIARTIDDTRRTATPSLTDDPYLKTLEFQGRKMLNKIPFASKFNAPYVDVWGNEQDKPTIGHKVDSAIENFVSPGFLRYDNKDKVDKELIRMAEKTGDMDFIPSKVKNEMKFKGEELKAKGNDYAKMQKLAGQSSYEKVSDLIGNSEEVKDYSGAYSDSKKMAQRDYVIKAKNIKPYEYDFEMLSDKKKEKYDEVKDTVDKEDFVNGIESIKGIKGAGESQRKVVELIRDGITDTEAIKAITGASDGTVKKARKVARTKYSTDEIKRFNESAKGSKGRVTKASAVAWLNSTNYSQSEKRLIFAILTSERWRNPF